MTFTVLIETLWNVKTFNTIILFSFPCCINRNIVECKVWNGQLFRFLQCINRNIVECKECYIVCPSRKSISINRNIVECKDQRFYFLRPVKPVLIETLWNVKYLLRLHVSSFPPVLIETLWNVKCIMCQCFGILRMY